MSGAAARTGTVKQIKNNKKEINMEKTSGGFQKKTNDTKTKNRNL